VCVCVCVCGNPAQHILHCFQQHLVKTQWANPHWAMDYCAWFLIYSPTSYSKITQNFRNCVCPILKWNGQQSPTNSSDCLTQFSSCVPNLPPDDGNRSSSNNCLFLLSTQNNNQTPDTGTSQSNILPSESSGTGTVFQQFDSTLWHGWTIRWMFCCQLCTPGGSLSATATSSTLQCVTGCVTSSVCTVPATLLTHYFFLCIWEETKENNRTMLGPQWNVYVIRVL